MTVPVRRPGGIPTDIVGLAFLLDPSLAPIDSPHGRVEFVQAFGISAGELERIRAGTGLARPRAATSSRAIAVRVLRHGERREDSLASMQYGGKCEFGS